MNLGLRLLPGLFKPSLLRPGPLLCTHALTQSSSLSFSTSRTRKNSPPSTPPAIAKNICTTPWSIDGKNLSKEKHIENKGKSFWQNKGQYLLRY